VDMDLIGWVGVGLGGTYGCRCGILYAHMLAVVFYAGLVSLTSSSYPSPCISRPSNVNLIYGKFISRLILLMSSSSSSYVILKCSKNTRITTTVGFAL